jgi:AcrR family transcriptional regulator
MTATPIASRQQRRTERTRTRLLDAALELFLERGYDAPSIAEITERADLGAGTYYLHFRDKRSLYEAVVRRELLALRGSWIEERTTRKLGKEPWAEVALMVEMVLESLLQDSNRARLILLDGPPLETWLLEEIGREMARVLGDRVASSELVANLVIGSTLNAGRWALTRSQPVSIKRLVAGTVAFCAAGVAAASAPRKKRRNS